VLPLDALFTSAGETVIATPLAGFVEFTVSEYVVVVVPPPPPQAAIPRLKPVPSAAIQIKPLIHFSLLCR
jgi:hypothetical protein